MQTQDVLNNLGISMMNEKSAKVGFHASSTQRFHARLL